MQSDQIQIAKIVEALKEIVEDYIDFCIDDEQDAMDEFCEKVGVEDDEECEALWDAIASHFYDIIKIRIELDEEMLRRVIDEMRSSKKNQKPIRIGEVKTMNEMLNNIV